MVKFEKLNFGTAGVPITSPSRSLIEGIPHVRNLGLDSLELEFVQQVYVKPEQTEEIKRIASKDEIYLTCHGQYYINLNAKEPEKLVASQKRIYQAAKIADMCGAKFITFHAGYYLGQDKEEVYKKIRDSLEEVKDKLDSEDCKIMLRPELTGKPTQFGNLKELVRLSQDLGILPCIDFAHMHARHGKHNSTSEFRDTLEYLEKELDCLKNMHIHMAGINYGEKGEKNHLMLEDSDMKWKELLKVWKEFDIKGIVTCESPNIEVDARLMKDYYKNI